MSAIDDLNALQGSLAGRAGAFDPALLDLQGMFGSASGAWQNAINNQNTATGLSPEAISALRTQGTSGINDQYQSAAQAMNTQLLRRGAAGGGELPGSGGDISRAYQPLYSAMEAAKTKAQTDTILADEAAKRQSLYQNQQMALDAANKVYGTANTLYNSGNSALTGAAGIANAAGELETPDIWKLLEAALLNQAIGGGGGTGAGGTGSGGGGGWLDWLTKGTGTNSTGTHGILGDLLGKLKDMVTGGNPTQTPAPSTGPIQGPVQPQSPNPIDLAPIIDLPNIFPGAGGIGTGIPGFGGEVPGSDQAQQFVAGGGGQPTAPASDAGPGYDVNESSTSDNLLKIGGAWTGAVAANSIIAAMTPAAAESAVGALTGAGAVGGSSGLTGATMGLLSNPVTAIAAAAILGTIAFVKSQAHWEANTWTKGFQTPFDNKMAETQQEINQLKSSGQYTPEVAATMQANAKVAIDTYLQQLDKFYREKGTKSDQAQVASQAWATFQKYYGPGGEYYLNGLSADAQAPQQAQQQPAQGNSYDSMQAYLGQPQGDNQWGMSL